MAGIAAMSPNKALTAASSKPWALAKAVKLLGSGVALLVVMTLSCAPRSSVFKSPGSVVLVVGSVAAATSCRSCVGNKPRIRPEKIRPLGVL